MGRPQLEIREKSARDRARHDLGRVRIEVQLTRRGDRQRERNGSFRVHPPVLTREPDMLIRAKARR